MEDKYLKYLESRFREIRALDEIFGDSYETKPSEEVIGKMEEVAYKLKEEGFDCPFISECDEGVEFNYFHRSLYVTLDEDGLFIFSHTPSWQRRWPMTEDLDVLEKIREGISEKRDFHNK